jgi:hypothetical protein
MELLLRGVEGHRIVLMDPNGIGQASSGHAAGYLTGKKYKKFDPLADIRQHSVIKWYFLLSHLLTLYANLVDNSDQVIRPILEQVDAGVMIRNQQIPKTKRPRPDSPYVASWLTWYPKRGEVYQIDPSLVMDMLYHILITLGVTWYPFAVVDATSLDSSSSSAMAGASPASLGIPSTFSSSSSSSTTTTTTLPTITSQSSWCARVAGRLHGNGWIAARSIIFTTGPWAVEGLLGRHPALNNLYGHCGIHGMLPCHGTKVANDIKQYDNDNDVDDNMSHDIMPSMAIYGLENKEGWGGYDGDSIVEIYGKPNGYAYVHLIESSITQYRSANARALTLDDPPILDESFIRQSDINQLYILSRKLAPSYFPKYEKKKRLPNQPQIMSSEAKDLNIGSNDDNNNHDHELNLINDTDNSTSSLSGNGCIKQSSPPQQSRKRKSPSTNIAAADPDTSSRNKRLLLTSSSSASTTAKAYDIGACFMPTLVDLLPLMTTLTMDMTSTEDAIAYLQHHSLLHLNDTTSEQSLSLSTTSNIEVHDSDPKQNGTSPPPPSHSSVHVNGDVVLMATGYHTWGMSCALGASEWLVDHILTGTSSGLDIWCNDWSISRLKPLSFKALRQTKFTSTP